MFLGLQQRPLSRSCPSHTDTICLPYPQILAITTHGRIPSQELLERDSVLGLNRSAAAARLHDGPLVAVTGNTALRWAWGSRGVRLRRRR